MNPDNYGTLPACQRLEKAGIVMETEFHWIRERDGSFTLTLSDVHYDGEEEYPAPSMAEVWRELPKKLPHRGYIVEPHLCKREDTELHYASYAWEPSGGFYEVVSLYENTNPTDALIDLLIWLKGQGKEQV